MKMLQRTRLAVAVLALGGFGLGSVAQADPFVGRLIGSVAAGMLVNGAMKSHDKKFAAQCRLYDREGNEVYLPCDSRRPLGEVLLAERPVAMADGLAGGPPPPEEVAPRHHDAAFDSGHAYAAPPAYAPPVIHEVPPHVRYAPALQVDCGCEHDLRDRPPHHSADLYISARGGHAQTVYGAGRVVGIYDAYAESSSSSSIRYSESYGSSGGFHPYGGVAYEAGGYAEYGYDRARVAGRDRNGFLTWAGKPVR
jgi:hypothetical protein